MNENNSLPTIFSITREEEIRYYRNDEMNLNDLIKRYSECERPFIELGETTHSQRIGTMDFVELEQTLGTTSIEIVPDENRVTVYENKGNDVYENELGDEFKEYKLSELLQKLEKEPIKSEKSTITVDENDLIIYAKKIEKNNSEDKNFEIKVNDFISGRLSPNEVLKIGTTPNCLRAAGAKAIPLVITQSVLSNSMEAIEASKTASKKHSEQHDIQIDIIKSLPKLLRNPIMINKGNQPDTVVLISEAKNKEGQNIVVPMILNVKGQNSRVNRITTIHGKKNIENYLNKAVVNNSIIAVNKTKADKLFSDIGIQSPKSTTIICFDNSIAYSMQNVKIPEEIVRQNSIEKDNPLRNAEMSMEQNYNSIDGVINKKEEKHSSDFIFSRAAQKEYSERAASQNENSHQTNERKNSHEMDL